ncbi:MAG: preprotein translocase subunit SecG [Parcubacteria group bacterium]|nr:preprotein translocase subunit SecG [Parcubacteria group bacterium]MCR4342288.1 preprotein translocase subunit SecG [Patescibacteria group bacterium]
MEIVVKSLPFIQIILSVLLVTVILLQQTGDGLGGAFGGSSDGGSYHTRRGMEKILFTSTIILGILFVLSTFFALII